MARGHQAIALDPADAGGVLDILERDALILHAVVLTQGAPPVPLQETQAFSPLEERKRRWENVLPTLKEDQQLIYQTILDADGMIPQSDIVEKTGLSKSNVSRSLDMLESMGFIEKRRRGMGNLILLK